MGDFVSWYGFFDATLGNGRPAMSLPFYVNHASYEEV